MTSPRRIPAVADAHARRASVCPAPCRWPRILLRRGSKPSCSSTASASAFWYKSVDALWYSSAGQRLLRIVVVRDPSHRRHDDCFFSTDRTQTPPDILTTFSLRWPLEVCFRDVKQRSEERRVGKEWIARV